MKKPLVSMKPSRFEAFKKNELQQAMTGLVRGKEGVGSSQTESRYDDEGNLLSCRARYDTQVIDRVTLEKTYVWGDWVDC